MVAPRPPAPPLRALSEGPGPFPPVAPPPHRAACLPACATRRNFTAGAEGWTNSWVNYYPPFVRRYGDDDGFHLTPGASPLFDKCRHAAPQQLHADLHFKTP